MCLQGIIGFSEITRRCAFLSDYKHEYDLSFLITGMLLCLLCLANEAFIHFLLKKFQLNICFGYLNEVFKFSHLK